MSKVHRFGISLILITALLFESSSLLISPALAKADDLVIEDNGSIVLFITDNSVLAASSDKKQEAPTPAKGTTKVVVPPKTDSTVKIDPKPSSDNKVKITVQTPAANTVLPSNIKQTSPTTNTGSPVPAVTSAPQTAVDKVVLNGPDQNPVVTISGNNSNNLNIQNGSVNTSTSLPIQVDNSVSADGSVKHDISVSTQSGPAIKLSVLPDVAVKAADEQVIKSSLPVSNKNVSLSQTSSLGISGSDPTYVVKEQRSGKLFDLVKVNLSSQVDISATSGKTVSSWQSPLSIFGFLIK